MKDELLELLTYDLVESRQEFKSIKGDISKLVKSFDGDGIEWSYDEFCLRLIENLKNKEIESDPTVGEMKKTMLDCMVEICITELENRGKKSESEIVYNVLKNREYEDENN